MTAIRTLSELGATPHAKVFPDAEPKTVRLALAEGEAIPAHDHPDREIVLYVIEGAIELRLDDEVHELAADDVVRFDGDRQISPRAVADSVALIVLAPGAED